MAFEFKMPDIGEGLADGEVVRWVIEVGDVVEQDASLVEVETDKAVMVIPAPRAGVLLFRGGDEGSIVKVGELLAVIGEADEQWPAEAQAATVPTVLAPEEEQGRPIVGTLEEAAPSRSSSSSPPTPSLPTRGRQLASPPTRKHAKNLGVNLAAVRGTGPGGRVLRTDIDAHLSGSTVPVEDTHTRLSGRRRAISEHLSRSWREIPHVTAFESVRAEGLMAARRVLAERLGEQVPIEALLIRAVLPVLAAMPEFNSCIEGETVTRRGAYNIGVSVDTPEGLVVPVIHNAVAKDVRRLSFEILSLAEKAKARKLERADQEGLTFTVSNIGAIGGGNYGTPIIPFGTAAILSVGRAEKSAVVENDCLVVGLTMPLSLSYDHRLIDGGTGRRFLAQLRKNLEEPLYFLAS
ncbi:MAG: hypothetical protein GEU71_03080 [Actinobacteria bacterium]|nr:hypothetical protein [Actinomycetota bacterium]